MILFYDFDGLGLLDQRVGQDGEEDLSVMERFLRVDDEREDGSRDDAGQKLFVLLSDVHVQ